MTLSLALAAALPFLTPLRVEAVSFAVPYTSWSEDALLRLEVAVVVRNLRPKPLKLVPPYQTTLVSVDRHGRTTVIPWLDSRQTDCTVDLWQAVPQTLPLGGTMKYRHDFTIHNGSRGRDIPPGATHFFVRERFSGEYSYMGGYEGVHDSQLFPINGLKLAFEPFPWTRPELSLR